MADETSKAESAQALFCAMADFIGAAKVDKVFNTDLYPDYDSFKNNWNETYPHSKIQDAFKQHVDSNISSLKEIEDFLRKTSKNKPSEWYISSVKIAKKLIKDIDDISNKFGSIKKPSWSSIFYVRGDKVIMKSIEILFKEALLAQKQINKIIASEGGTKKIIFGDINKWSPADIYFSSPKAKKEILSLVKNKKGLTFESLNLFVAKLISNGDLLPLSLKKQTHEVTIHKINFSRPETIKELEKVKAYGLSNWKPRKLNAKGSRSLEIYLSEDKKQYLQLLHVTDDSGGWKGNNMIRGSQARHGSLGSQNVFHDALAIIDKPFAKRWLSQFTSANNIFKAELKEYVKKELKGVRPKTPPKGTPKTADRIKFENKREELSSELTDKLHPIFISWYKKNNNDDKFARVIYEYVSSQSDESGPFVIAK
jgi:hypothetical protein